MAEEVIELDYTTARCLGCLFQCKNGIFSNSVASPGCLSCIPNPVSKQGCGSWSALIWVAGSGSGSSRAEEKSKSKSAGCSLLRSEEFYWSLDVLSRGLGIGFWSQFSCDQNTESGSVFSLKCWIRNRIRIKWIRIRNTVPNGIWKNCLTDKALRTPKHSFSSIYILQDLFSGILSSSTLPPVSTYKGGGRDGGCWVLLESKYCRTFIQSLQ